MVVKAERDLVMGADLYREVAKPKPGLEIFDLLKMRREISSLADEAIQDSPLDGRLYRLRALSALPMRSNLSEVSRDFAIDRQLEPNAVRVPMIHASASLFYAEKEVAKAWSEAILRSERVDEKKGNKRLREMTVQKIQSQVSRSPQLRGLFEKTTQKR